MNRFVDQQIYLHSQQDYGLQGVRSSDNHTSRISTEMLERTGGLSGSLSNVTKIAAASTVFPSRKESSAAAVAAAAAAAAGNSGLPLTVVKSSNKVDNRNESKLLLIREVNRSQDGQLESVKLVQPPSSAFGVSNRVGTSLNLQAQLNSANVQKKFDAKDRIDLSAQVGGEIFKSNGKSFGVTANTTVNSLNSEQFNETLVGAHRPRSSSSNSQPGFHSSSLSKMKFKITVLSGGEAIEVEEVSPKRLAQTTEQKNTIRINLKHLLEIETCLAKTSEYLDCHSNAYIDYAQRFIDLIFEDPQFCINQAYKLFTEERLGRLGKSLNILELVSVFTVIELGRKKRTTIQVYFGQMKTLLNYTHQSFLMLWDIIYHILDSAIEDKECLSRLRERIEEKRNVKLGTKQSSFTLLKGNYEMLTKLIQPMMKEIGEASNDIQKLFKVCEDLPIEEVFRQVQSIFKQQSSSLSEQKALQEKQRANGGTNKYVGQKQIDISKVSESIVNENSSAYLFAAPVESSSILTLVLDLDETLIHFVEGRSGGQFLTRPFCEKFLREMSKLFELIIFTAGTEDYANWVLDQLDTKKLIRHRLYRQHTKFSNGVYIKDLNRIGRDLSRMIIVDNVPENFRLQKENGIAISSWYSDRTDTALRDLIPVLSDIAKESKASDIRVAMKKIKQKYASRKMRNNFELPL